MLSAAIKKSAKKDFLSAIVHELKTPISAIIGFSEILEDEVKNPKFAEECAYYAKEINLASLELLDIVHDLLDVGAANSGVFAVDFSKKIDVVDVMRRAIRLNWDYALKRNVKLKFEVAGQEIPLKLNADQSSVYNVPQLHLDAKRMKQILTNLISNAVKYSAAKTEVKIAVRVINSENFSNGNAEQQVAAGEECLRAQRGFSRFAENFCDKFLEITVSDQGFGMSNDQLSRLFTRYQTFQNPNSGNVDSTGLGLSITKELVEMQGGTIAVTSEVNKGTEFLLRFPIFVEQSGANFKISNDTYS